MRAGAASLQYTTVPTAAMSGDKLVVASTASSPKRIEWRASLQHGWDGGQLHSARLIGKKQHFGTAMTWSAFMLTEIGFVI